MIRSEVNAVKLNDAVVTIVDTIQHELDSSSAYIRCYTGVSSFTTRAAYIAIIYTKIESQSENAVQA